MSFDELGVDVSLGSSPGGAGGLVADNVDNRELVGVSLRPGGEERVAENGGGLLGAVEEGHLCGVGGIAEDGVESLDLEKGEGGSGENTGFIDEKVSPQAARREGTRERTMGVMPVPPAIIAMCFLPNGYCR